jgi:hypothetical protein
MGRNSKGKRDAKKKAATRRSNQRQGSGAGFSGSPIGGFAGMSGEDTSVMMLISTWDSLDPADGKCPGPVILHEDGAFECHGTCESAMAVWHEAHNGGTRYCPGGITALRNACPRCFEVAAVSPDRLDLARCMGTQIDHQDGVTTCTEGEACPGDEVFHASGMSCSFFGPCERCAA